MKKSRCGSRFVRGLVLGGVLLMAVAGTPVPASAQLADAGGRNHMPAPRLEAGVTGDTVRVLLKERGSSFEGVLRAKKDNSLRLETLSGRTVTIGLKHVYAVRRISEMRSPAWNAYLEKRIRPDPSRTRLLVGPTARPHPQNQFYLAGHQVVFPYAAYGLHHRLTLRAGGSVLSYQAQFLYGGTKIALKRKGHIRMAIGGIGAATTNVITSETGKDEYGGVAYGVMTVQQHAEGPFPGHALTIGGGYIANGGVYEERSMAMLGGEVRLSRGFKLLTENYLLLDPDWDTGSGEKVSGIVSLGLRFTGVRFIGGRTSLDVGAFTAVPPAAMQDVVNVPVLPIVTFSYAFGTEMY